MRFINGCLFDVAMFVTLTYRYNQTDVERGYKDLRLFAKGLSRAYGEVCIVWKRELQKRGAVHFHLFILDPPDGYNESSIRDEWLRVTMQKGDLAAREYGTQTKKIDLLKQGDAGVIVAYLAKYTGKETSAVLGKSWGILGRKKARETSQSISVKNEDAYEACRWLLSRGGRSFDLTPTGIQYRLYLGHLGGEGATGGDNRITDFLSQFAEKVIE